MINLIDFTKSKVRKKILQYFFTNPEKEDYLREIARKFDEDPSNLLKEMTRLEKEKIFVSDMRGKQKYYKLNTSHPLYNELKSIVFKTIGIRGELENIVNKDNSILSAFIYGSYAKNLQDSTSDVDILMVIDEKKFDENKLISKIHKLESLLSREFNYIYYSDKELSKKIAGKDSFITNIINKSKIILKGQELIERIQP
jgi:predicted nucleotidyltransferase/predicted transcriptional regulator with HTH domain